MGIYSTIKKEWDGYVDDDVEIVPGYSFNQYSTIKRIHLYHNSRFENAEDFDGREKLFFNVTKYRCTVASKGLNFDTKDIRLWPKNPTSVLATFLLEKELEQWMKKNKIGVLLNQMADELPIYGTIILKKTKNGAKLVDLRRIAMDPTVERIQDSRFVTLKHYLTEPELRAKIKDGWDEKAVKAIIEAKAYASDPTSYEDGSGARRKLSSPYFEVYERYGEVKESELTGKTKDGDSVRSLFIVAAPLSNGNKGNEEGTVLFKSKWSGPYPFKDCHYSKTKGRYLGIGVIEDLFPAQERRNEMANQKRVSMEISGMHLFQTANKTTTLQNVLTDLRNGDVLATGMNGAITPLPTEERNLPAFGEEQKEYDALADRLSFSYDVIRGESMPASTPVTNTLIQNQNVQSVFAYKRENLGLMLQEYFNELVLPQLVRDLDSDHTLRFMGGVEDLAKIDRLTVRASVREKAMAQMLEGKAVTAEDLARMEADAEAKLRSRGNSRFLDVAKGFYKDAEFEFDFMVTNEQENVAGAASNLMQLITALAGNPQLLQEPTIKALVYEYAQKIGISPLKLESAEGKRMESQEARPQQMPQGVQPMPTQPQPRQPNPAMAL